MGYFNELSMTPDSRPFSDEGWHVEDRRTPPPTPAVTEAPKGVTKRIGEWDALTKDYPAFVCFEDGTEEYIGSRPTTHDASLLASDYIIQWYQDNHTPEKAAQLIHDELITEGRHAEMAQDMGGVWATGECWEEVGAPDEAELREWAKEDAAPVEPEPPVDDGPDDNFGGFRQPITMGDAEALVHAMRHVPLPDEERYRHRLPIDPPPCDNCEDKGGCPECDPAQEALSATEFLAQAQVPAPTCMNCAGPHPTWRCPEIGALLMAPERYSSCSDPSQGLCAACKEVGEDTWSDYIAAQAAV